MFTDGNYLAVDIFVFEQSKMYVKFCTVHSLNVVIKLYITVYRSQYVFMLRDISLAFIYYNFVINKQQNRMLTTENRLLSKSRP